MIKKVKIPSKKKLAEYQETDTLLKETAVILKCSPDEVHDRVKTLIEKIKNTKEELDSINKKLKEH